MAQTPPVAEDALKHLEESPRHGEWARYDAGMGDMVDAWLVYPERSDGAPVVVVVHEIFGLTDWVRAVADQFAAEGFIAIAPDLLSGKGPDGGNTSSVSRDAVRGLIRGLDREEVHKRLDAAAAYATALPAAEDRYGVVGYCWGGAISFSYATHQPELGAATVFYGTSPATETLSAVRAPVLGLYGGEDNRVNATIADAEAEMKRLGKSYEKEVYQGAGHGFLRQQDRMNNKAAADQAWVRTVEFFKKHLEGHAMMMRVSDDPFAIVQASMIHDDGCSDTCETEMMEVGASVAAAPAR
jgi:carboxymethylenebutenolidase